MPDTNGRLLHHLPGIYHQSDSLRQLLSVFESFLYGLNTSVSKQAGRRAPEEGPLPLADNIGAIASIFSAWETPREFLPWLSQWVALSDFGELSEAQHRQLIAEIVPLYALRGTKVYMERLLELIKPDALQIAVDDSATRGFTVGISKIGADTVFLSDLPFRFKVTVTLPTSEKDRPDMGAYRAMWEKRLRRIIDLTKPVHTVYTLDWDDPA